MQISSQEYLKEKKSKQASILVTQQMITSTLRLLAWWLSQIAGLTGIIRIDTQYIPITSNNLLE